MRNGRNLRPIHDTGQMDVRLNVRLDVMLVGKLDVRLDFRIGAKLDVKLAGRN